MRLEYREDHWRESTLMIYYLAAIDSETIIPRTTVVMGLCAFVQHLVAEKLVTTSDSLAYFGDFLTEDTGAVEKIWIAFY